MGFIRRAFEFVASPSHSRTLGLVLMLVLVAAVSLTVYVAQQQQETRQRASGPGQVASYAPEPRNKNADPDIDANVASNFGCREGYHVINPEICCPLGTIYCNLPKDNPINLCADNSDACNALIEARTGIPDCGDNLKCDASTISGACSARQNKCLSSKGFGGAEKASPNGKSVVCCNVPTPTPTAKKIVGENCVQTAECESGLTCEIYEEVGYGTCIAPTPTPSLFVTLSANPSSGTAPLNGVTLTAQVSGDTITRTYRYIFSCSGTLTAFNSIDTDATTATRTNICNFPKAGTHTAGVQVNTISGPYNLPVTNSITITVNAPPTPAQVAIVNTPTPTPVVTSSTCINITDVNSLARLYLQGHSTVTLQDVNSKARQYNQNPCP